MDERFLIDTNILIYYFDDKIPVAHLSRSTAGFRESLQVSTITKIELLCWHQITGEEKARMEDFLHHAEIYFVDKQVQSKAIEIKQKAKIKTPDAIIAATAVLFDFTIVSRNVKDFEKVRRRRIHNPFED